MPRTSQLTKMRGRKCVADGSLMKAAEKNDFRDRKYVSTRITPIRNHGANQVCSSGGVSGRGTAGGKHGSLLYYYAQIALAMGFCGLYIHVSGGVS